jgi:hypothetical protein
MRFPLRQARAWFPVLHDTICSQAAEDSIHGLEGMTQAAPGRPIPIPPRAARV